MAHSILLVDTKYSILGSRLPDVTMQCDKRLVDFYGNSVCIYLAHSPKNDVKPRSHAKDLIFGMVNCEVWSGNLEHKVVVYDPQVSLR